MKNTKQLQNAFRDVPYMGVIWVVAEAMKLGFYNGHPDWSNLGQGQPEVGEIKGAPPRIHNITIQPDDHAYGPVNGINELRETVAQHYNRLYRKDHTSKYTAENVSIAMGGRLVLSRIFAALCPTRLGYQVPDYTAYEDMINYQGGRITPIKIPPSREAGNKGDIGFGIPGSEFRDVVENCNLNACVMSNPCNPTGNLIAGDDLATYVNVARELNCTMIFDEFYSHFIYDGDKPGSGPVSSAAYVQDVDSDQVIIVDGLTKSFRYPGWRIGWAIGSKNMIDILGRVASTIDGGPSQFIQRAAIEVLIPERADQETHALRQVFSRKRNVMIAALKEMGISYSPEPQGTFYVWANISKLPSPLNNADTFFYEALKKKVLTVPGHFFDINPGKEQKPPSLFNQWVRFSFGPEENNIKMGLERLAEMIRVF